MHDDGHDIYSNVFRNSKPRFPLEITHDHCRLSTSSHVAVVDLEMPQGIPLHTTTPGARVKVGDTVELIDGDFLRVALIIEILSTGKLYLRGNQFRRACRLEGMATKSINEVLMLVEHDLDDP